MRRSLAEAGWAPRVAKAASAKATAGSARLVSFVSIVMTSLVIVLGFPSEALTAQRAFTAVSPASGSASMRLRSALPMTGTSISNSSPGSVRIPAM